MCKYAKANIRLTVITQLGYNVLAIVSDVCLFTCSIWCGGSKVGTQYTWSHSGSVLTYTNWGYGEPSIFAPCMNILSDGKGSDAECDSTFEFICEKPVLIYIFCSFQCEKFNKIR